MEEYVMEYTLLGEIVVLAESYAEAVNEASMEIHLAMGHMGIEELYIDGVDY